MLTNQLEFTLSSKRQDEQSHAVASAIANLSVDSRNEARGAIFTRREVVDFILDLAGYTDKKPLYTKKILEPSFGGGDFLFPIVTRLLSSWRKFKSPRSILEDLGSSLRAVELHIPTYQQTLKSLRCLLEHEGVDADTAQALTEQWLIQGDFLLEPFNGDFDFVVGNPPYLRQEMIPDVLLAEYRKRYKTIYDRADIYIPFIERSLSLLSPDGTLGFICSDRWMKNRYGAPLRCFVSRQYHLKFYVDMTDTPAFHSDVTAYPAITIISKGKPGKTLIVHRPEIDQAALRTWATLMLKKQIDSKSSELVREIDKVTNGSEPWLLGSSDQTALIRRLEQEFPLLEDVGCRVGIGVATGADKVFIGKCSDLDIEDDRKIPLATTKDIASGVVQWRGLCVINPFSASGGLVSLSDYPRLKLYFESRKEELLARHCAQKAPANWYRTIDRITPILASRPKLLIPDIKGEANVVYEEGKYYPHHNLYYIVSDDWDLRALQAVLLSEVTRLFVTTYSTKMRGGFLRFQAQYLRRIRLPFWVNVPAPLRKELSEAAYSLDMQACNAGVFKLYNLSHDERSSLGGNGG